MKAKHLNLCLPDFLLPSVFPKVVLSLYILIRLPVHSNLLTYIVVTIFVNKVSYAILNSKYYSCVVHRLHLTLHNPCFRS